MQIHDSDLELNDATSEEFVINLVFDYILTMRGNMTKRLAMYIRDLLTDYINGQDISIRIGE